MKDEFEVISHGAGQYKVFMVNLLYLSLIHISEPTRH